MNAPCFACFLALLGAAISIPGCSDEVEFPIRRNVIVFIADDVGAERIDTVSTPGIDLLAAQGLSFVNAWSNPTCSPTRAGILTGLHAFRHGVTRQLDDEELGLNASLETIPEALHADVSVALFGKWHLGAVEDTDGDGKPDGGTVLDLSTRVHGFDYFAGSLHGSLHDYDDWTKVVSTEGGTTSESTSTTHATHDAADEAYSWISAQIDGEKPFVAFVSFNAPHGTLKKTGGGFAWYEEDLCDAYKSTSSSDESAIYDAHLQCLDGEISDLIGKLEDDYPEALERTTVIFIGDNGTPSQVAASPVTSSTAKGTIYEGGVRVPFIVSDGYRLLHGTTPDPGDVGVGALVASPGEHEALVHTVDLYSTIMGLTVSGSATGIDSVTLVPYLGDYEHGAPRSAVYTQVVNPSTRGYAIRDERYKMVVIETSGDLMGSRDWEDSGLAILLYDLDATRYDSRSTGVAPTGAYWESIFESLSAAMEEVWDAS